MKITQRVSELHLEEWSASKIPSVFDFLKNSYFSAITAIDLQPYDIVFFADKVFHHMKRDVIRAAIRPIMKVWVGIEREIENGNSTLLPKRLTRRKIIQLVFPAIADCIQPRELSLQAPHWHENMGIRLEDYYIEFLDILKIENQTHGYFESTVEYNEKKEALMIK